MKEKVKEDFFSHRSARVLTDGLNVQDGIKEIWSMRKPKTKRIVLVWRNFLGIVLTLVAILYLTEGIVWTFDKTKMFEQMATSFLGLIGLYASIFWNHDQKFGKQWSYLAELFNLSHTEPDRDIF